MREWRGGALPAGTFVQERIDGLACSAAAVGDGVDAVVLGLTEQLVGERAFGVRGYRWCGNHASAPAGRRAGGAAGQARAICSCLAGAFALRGLSASTSSGTASARGRTRSTRAPPLRSRRSRRRPAWPRSTPTCAAAPASCPHRGRRSHAGSKAVLFATEAVTIGNSARWLRAWRARRPAPRRADRRGPSDLHRRGATRRRPTRCAGLEEQAARLPRSSRWRCRRVFDATCAGCGCACDDIEVTARRGPIRTCRSATRGSCPPNGHRPPASRAATARLDEAVDAAAAILRQARAPFVYGLNQTSCEAQRRAVALAEAIGAVVDRAAAARRSRTRRSGRARRHSARSATAPSSSSSGGRTRPSPTRPCWSLCAGRARSSWSCEARTRRRLRDAVGAASAGHRRAAPDSTARLDDLARRLLRHPPHGVHPRQARRSLPRWRSTRSCVTSIATATRSRSRWTRRQRARGRGRARLADRLHRRR